MSTITTAPIVGASQALFGLLRKAEELGLAMPYSVSISHHPEPHGNISLLVNTFAELVAWSSWLDGPIDSRTTCGDSIHHKVFGHAGPVPLVVVAIIDAEDVTA